MPAIHLPINLLVDLWLLAALTGLGLRIVQRRWFRDDLTRIAVASGVGIFLFIECIFILNTAGLFKFSILLGPLLAVSFLAITPLRSTRAHWKLDRFDAFEWALILIFVSVAVFNLFFNYAPPMAEDELVYHISLPALWVYWGKWINPPGLFASYFSLNGELLYAGVLLLRNVYAVKMMVWATGLLMSFSLYVFARKHIPLERREALLAVVLLYTSPMITSYNGITSVDLLVLFFEILTVILFWEWKASRQWRLIVLMGVFAGAGMGTKLFAVPWVLVTALFLLFFEKSLFSAFLFGCTTTLVFSPWMIRNGILTGNPFYPEPLWKGAASSIYLLSAAPRGTFAAWFKLPLFISTGNFIWSLGPLPWALAPFALFRYSSKKDLGALALFTFLVLSSLHVMPGVSNNARYYGGALPWLCVLAAAGFGALLAQTSIRLQRLLKVWIAGFLIFPNLALSAYFGSRRLPYILGRQSEEAYMREHYSGHEGFDMFHYLRRHLSTSETLLRMGDIPSSAAYFFPAQHILAMSAFEPDFYAVATSSELARALKEKGITEVLFEPFSFEWGSDGFWHLTGDALQIGIKIPPLTGPAFEKIHETTESTLYRVAG